jgi:hypothetical protein
MPSRQSCHRAATHAIVTHPLSLRTWTQRTMSVCVAILIVTAILLVGSPGVGRGAVLPAGAAATDASSAKDHCPSGSAAGITSSQVTVAASIIDITGSSLSNATVGVPSTQAQEADYNLVAKKINGEGGAGCRKIAMKFYDVNPIDAAGAQQTCLTIAASQPYIVLDSGALTEVGASTCIPQHHILLASSYLTPDDLTTDHPYALDIGGNEQQATRTGILAAHQLGYFSAAKGFKKLGVLYHTCNAGTQSIEQSALAASKVPAKDVDYFNLACPAGQNDTPASMEQAVLSFKNAGVTDVTEAGVNDVGLFTQVAQQQNYTPHYVYTDSPLAASNFTGPDAPNPTNFNGAIDIVEGGYGEATTPGFKPTGATKACDAIYAAGGQPSVYQQLDGYGGVVCDYLWFVQALLNHASTVQPSAQLTSMHNAGTVQFSYPFAPISFSTAPSGSGYGVAEWRAIFYHSSCKCWQVPDPTFNKSAT